MRRRLKTHANPFNPPHPGEILREDCLKPLRLTVTAAAKWLGVSRGALSELLNGHNGISPDMAIRLEKAGRGSAESWLRNQLSYDLWHARQRGSDHQSEALSDARGGLSGAVNCARTQDPLGLGVTLAEPPSCRGR